MIRELENGLERRIGDPIESRKSLIVNACPASPDFQSP